MTSKAKSLKERIRTLKRQKTEHLAVIAIVSVFPMIFFAGSLAGCGANQIEDELLNDAIQNEEGSNEININDNDNDNESVVSDPDRFALNEAEWPWLEDLALKHPEYSYSISWYGDSKDVKKGKEYYGIGYYLELEQGSPDHANIYEAPSFSETIIGELRFGDRVSCWPEKYQTEDATIYGYYYLWKEEYFWHFVQFNNNDTIMFGWIAEDETVRLNDEHILLYKDSSVDDDSEPIIYDWRRDDAYDPNWIWESDFALKRPEYADSIYWYGSFKGTLGIGIGENVQIKSGIEESVKIHQEPSFTAKAIGELHPGESADVWIERYQTKYAIVYGYYRVWNEGFFWSIYRISDNDNEMLGWIAQDESVLDFFRI